MTSKLEPIRVQVGTVLEAQEGIDEALEELNRAIDSHPGEPEPALAALQYRNADRLAPHMLADVEGPGDPRPALLTQHLKGDALGALRRMMRVHRPDLAFSLRIINVMDDLADWGPWLRYTFVLAALAAHPGNPQLRKVEARLLVKLASWVASDSEEIPAGYFEGRSGTRYHAMSVERALRAIDEVLANDADPDLLFAKGELLAALEEYADAPAACAKGPTPQQRAQLADSARYVAKQTAGLICVDVTELLPMAESKLLMGLAPWFGEIKPQLEAAGMVLVSLFDNPLNTRMLAAQYQGQFWIDPGFRCALTAETVRGGRVKRLVTELSDGRFVMTGDARPLTFYESGPDIDAISVDPGTPIGEMALFHLARVERRLADAPALRVMPIDSLERLAQVENRIRECKNAFRFEHGLTDVEIRGMHMPFHALFSNMVRTELAAQLTLIK